MKRIRQAPCAVLERIYQGDLGQTSPKPTDLLCVRAPHMQRCVTAFRRRRTDCRAAPQFLDDGTFGTAPLKEYPPRFSASMLMGIWSSARHPDLHEEDFDTAITILKDRCSDIENGTSTGPTPRTSVIPYPSMAFLAEWPVDCPAKFGPDFNAQAHKSIDASAHNCACRNSFVEKAKNFLDSGMADTQGNLGGSPVASPA